MKIDGVPRFEAKRALDIEEKRSQDRDTEDERQTRHR